MAIVNVKEVWSGREGGFNADFSRRYVRNFRVETDDTSDGPIEVGFAVGIPRLWERYVSHQTGEIDNLALCREVTPVQDAGNPYLWDVRCEYSTESPEPGGMPTGGGVPTGGFPDGADPGKPGAGGQADSPEAKPWEVEYEPETYRLPMRKAFDNQGPNARRVLPVLNAAKQPFDPLPEYEVGGDVLTVTRIEKNPDHQKLRQYAYALNSDDFLHAGFAQAQCLPIRRKRMWIGGQQYWECTYRIRFVPEGWDTWQPEILNAGRSQLTDDPSELPVEIRYPRSHQQIGHDWPLTRDGKAMTPEEIEAADHSDLYLTFYAYRVLPFSELNLTI